MNISQPKKILRQALLLLFFLATGMMTSVVWCQDSDGHDGMPAIQIEMPDGASHHAEPAQGPLAPVEEPVAGSSGESSASILSNELPPPGGNTDASESMGIGSLDLGSRKSIAKVVGSLAIVIAVFLILAKLFGKRTMRRPGALPHEVVRIQGTVPMDKKRDLMLIQMGAKLLLVVKSEQGIAPLGEVDDPQQVEWMVRKCNGGKNNNADLQNMLEQLMAGEYPSRNAISGNQPEPPRPAAAGADRARQRMWMSGRSRGPGRALFEA